MGGAIIGAVPASDATQAALVGRGDELQIALEAVSAARSGRGRLMLVRGDAGVGKTTLVREVARRAEPFGVTTLTGRAVEGGGPFRPLAEALVPLASDTTLADRPGLAPYRSVLARLLPGWAAGHGAPGQGELTAPLVDPVVVLGEALLQLLAELSAEGLGLVVLDDLHWADADTLKVLEYLAGRVTTAHVLVLAAARSDEHEAARLEPLARHPDTHCVTLTRLDDDVMAALLVEQAGAGLPEAVVRTVVAAADGVPFVAVELLSGFVESGTLQRRGEVWEAVSAPPSQVPSSFAGVVERRLARLDGDTCELLDLAAVVGPVLDDELLAAASGRDRDMVARALRHALSSHLLVRDPVVGTLGWRHALTRQALLSRLLPLERQALAERAGRSLLADGSHLSGDRRLVAVDLLEQAGLVADAASLLRSAAEDAIRSAALNAAEEMLLRAERLVSHHPGLAQDVAVELVGLSTLTGRVELARSVASRWLPRLSGHPRLRLQHAVARALVAVDRFDEAVAWLPQDPGDDPRVAALLAQVALGREEPADALRLAQWAVQVARQRGEEIEVVCEALEVVGRCHRRSQPDRAQKAFQEAEATATQAGLAPWRIRALLELGALDMLRGGGLTRLETARRLALDAGMLGRVAVLDLQIGAAISTRTGRVAAIPSLERAADRAGVLGMGAVRSMSLVLLSAGYVAAGRSAEAWQLLDEVTAIDGQPVDIHTGVCVRGLHEWLTEGDDRHAADLLEEGLDPLRGHPLAGPTPWWGVWAVLRTAVGDGGAAITELRESDVLVHVANEGALRYAEALQAAPASLPDARRALEQGDAVLEAMPYWRHVLRCVVARRAHEHGLGDIASWLREALAYFVHHEEVLFVARTRGLMRDLGIAVPRNRVGAGDVPPHLRASGVTGREYEILHLVATRLSNADIASRLHLSTRTVETHVSNLLAKTGATSRSELVEHL